jgi:hypothetical protein
MGRHRLARKYPVRSVIPHLQVAVAEMESESGSCLYNVKDVLSKRPESVFLAAAARVSARRSNAALLDHDGLVTEQLHQVTDVDVRDRELGPEHVAHPVRRPRGATRGRLRCGAVVYR